MARSGQNAGSNVIAVMHSPCDYCKISMDKNTIGRCPPKRLLIFLLDRKEEKGDVGA
jgi:hypothetical protein